MVTGLRNHWRPIAASSAVTDQSARRTLLSEDLFAFRAPDGAVRVFQEYIQFPQTIMSQDRRVVESRRLGKIQGVAPFMP